MVKVNMIKIYCMHGREFHTFTLELIHFMECTICRMTNSMENAATQLLDKCTALKDSISGKTHGGFLRSTATLQT